MVLFLRRTSLLANRESVGYKLTPEYVAGFFDGEGSVGIYPRNTDRTGKIKYFVLVVSVAQSGEFGYSILTHLCNIFGGTVYSGKPHPTKKKMWYWNISADKGASFLNWFRFSSIIKISQIETALQFQMLSNKRFDNPEAVLLATKIKELKQV